MKRFFLILFILSTVNTTMFGKIVFPSIFSDNMVLQQNSKVAIWGWAGPSEKINIVTSWNNDTIKVKANNMSKWETTMRTSSAGGPLLYQNSRKWRCRIKKCDAGRSLVVQRTIEHGNVCQLETNQRRRRRR